MVIAFVSDRLEWNCKFRVLNVIDDFECEVVALEVSRSSMLAEGGDAIRKDNMDSWQTAKYNMRQ